jgi:signal transduction histidine kinase/ActR/RegA family two-component response regulator
MKYDASFQLAQAAWPALLVSPGGEILDANSAAASLFGALLNARQVSALGTGEGGPGNLLARWEQIGAALSPLEFRDKTGASLSFLTSVSPLPADNETVLLLQLFPSAAAVGRMGEVRPAGIEVSVTQRQKLDCAMQLTRTVALDFNNALTTVLGHVSYVLGQMEANHPWRFSLGEAEKAAEKAAEIAKDLAAFSLEEKDKRAQVAGNLNLIVRRAMQLFETPERKNLIWSQKFESRIFTVNFDEAKLQQAFVRILENAVEALAADKTNGQINVETRNVEHAVPAQDGGLNLAPGAYVCVEISDNGAGIDQAALPRIFEPFFSNKPGHRGLGLAWVYGIVTNHGGGVAVASEVGQGTAVRVYMPATLKIVEEKFIAEQGLSGEGTVLFVDDEEMVVTLGRMLLTSAGYKVLAAGSGEQALEVINQSNTPIDLLITDMVMPKMNGRELIEKVRVLSPATRVICSTACVRSVHGVDDLDYLPKPFTCRELLARVKHTLQGLKTGAPAA